MLALALPRIPSPETRKLVSDPPGGRMEESCTKSHGHPPGRLPLSPRAAGVHEDFLLQDAFGDLAKLAMIRQQDQHVGTLNDFVE